MWHCMTWPHCSPLTSFSTILLLIYSAPHSLPPLSSALDPWLSCSYSDALSRHLSLGHCICSSLSLRDSFQISAIFLTSFRSPNSRGLPDHFIWHSNSPQPPLHASVLSISLSLPFFFCHVTFYHLTCHICSWWASSN